MKRPEWPCRVEGCTALSAYVAKDNRATYGHICYQHHRQGLHYHRTDINPEHYTRIEDAP